MFVLFLPNDEHFKQLMYLITMINTLSTGNAAFYGKYCQSINNFTPFDQTNFSRIYAVIHLKMAYIFIWRVRNQIMQRCILVFII